MPPIDPAYGLDRKYIERLIYRTAASLRYTQDSPVMPDVWIMFAQQPNDKIDLILTPHIPISPAALATKIREFMSDEERKEAEVAYNQTSAVARCTFKQMIRTLLPMSHWWCRN